MTHKRSEKVAEAIHETVSGLLIKGIKDPRIGFVTITGVEVSDDLHHARIFFSVVGSEDERVATAEGLNSARGFIRRELGKSLRMRYVPEVVFRYDESLAYGNKIDSLLKEISETEKTDDSEHSE